jgi:Flp pilus assembly protein TadD
VENFHQALKLQSQDCLDAAILCYQGAVEACPSYVEALYNLALLLQQLGRREEAIPRYRQVLDIAPGFAPAWNNLGAALRDAGHPSDAIECYRQSLRLKPDGADCLNNLGLALRAGLQLDEAIDCFQKSLRLSPANPCVWDNLGNAFRDAGRIHEAVGAFEKAITLKPGFAEAHYDLGFVLLLTGDFKRGWPEYEWRWRRADFPPRSFACPLWQGSEDVAGKTLLVCTEQGFGDAIQFARLVPVLAARGARIVLECQPALESLFASLEGVSAVIPRGQPVPPADFHVPMLSLPHRLDLSLDRIPARMPYVRPVAGRERVLPPAARQEAFKVGLVWAGNPNHVNDRHRSIPWPLVKSLLDVPGIAFHSLQADATATADASDRLVSLAPMMHDFADTAALIRQLHLVITVDTAVAHLAGALGTPVWTLLPCAPDWRWMLNRDDSPWYPSMRLIRQSRPGDWSSVIARVCDDLRRILWP